jgi:hypothetical protein
MFSDHLPKIDELPNRMLFLVAAVLVILCQLVAMAMVVGGQVDTAQLRDASRAFERNAINQCLESNLTATRHSCMEQTNVADAYAHNRQSTQALANTGGSDMTALPSNPVESFLPASFTARQ